MKNRPWTPGPWRIAKNKWNVKNPPWRGAIGIEAPEDEYGRLAVPPLIAWTLRGGAQEADARLIATAPTMAEYIRKRADDGDQDAIDLWMKITG